MALSKDCPMADIYSPPGSTLHEQPSGNGFGSLERGMRGDYPLEIGAILNEAWAKTRGAKWPFQLALTLFIVVYFVVSLVVGLVLPSPVTTVTPDFDTQLFVTIFIHSI